MTAFDFAWKLVKMTWDSTCDKCKFHYYNEDGDGPTGRPNDGHGDHGWITESDFGYEMEDVAEDIDDPEYGEDWYQFHNWLQERMRKAGWDVLCGDCRDGLEDDWNATRRKWA